MKILVTGASGFIGWNLVASLRAQRPSDEVLTFDRENPPGDLDRLARACDFACHLAGVNRPRDPAEFLTGNRDLTRDLVEALERHRNPAPILMTSSIQACLDNPYGQSKLAAEALLADHAHRTGHEVLIYRLPNAFGKGCRPNYNSAIATFCHQVARGRPLDVRDPERRMTLAYIDDVVDEFLRAIDGQAARAGDFCEIPITHEALLGDIASRIQGFASDRRANVASDLADPLTRKLYATYLSHLPMSDWRTPLDVKSDARGAFAEFLRLGGRGQVSINVARPGVTKGRHWHHTKSEKFLVVSGRGRIRLRRLGEAEVTAFDVCGEMPEVIDIPVGCAHELTNTGEVDLVTVMWASEPFDPEHPDTYPEGV